MYIVTDGGSLDIVHCESGHLDYRHVLISEVSCKVRCPD